MPQAIPVLSATKRAFVKALKVVLDSATNGNYLRVASNNVEERTPAQVLSDIGAASTSHTHTESNITDLAHDTNEYIIIAVSDETSDLTTGTAKVTFRMPYAMTLSAVKVDVNDAPTGSAIQVDINEGGTSILSTKLTIDATEETSETAATPAVISDAALADNAEITIDIDSVGSTNPGKGLKVTLIGAR